MLHRIHSFSNWKTLNRVVMVAEMVWSFLSCALRSRPIPIHQVNVPNVSTSSYSLKTHLCIFFHPLSVEELTLPNSGALGWIWWWVRQFGEVPTEPATSSGISTAVSPTPQCGIVYTSSSPKTPSYIFFHPLLEEFSLGRLHNLKDGCNKLSWRYGCMIRSPAKHIDIPTFIL